MKQEKFIATKKIIVTVLIVITLFSIISCTKENSITKNPVIKIVTTDFPCYDFVRAIIGDTKDVELTMLIKPGTEIHSYDPSPSDIIAINKADLFIYIGGESDEWVAKILNANDNSKNRNNDQIQLSLIHVVDTVTEAHIGDDNHDFEEETDEHNHDSEEEADEHNHDSEEEADEHNHDSEEEADEHIWTSPNNAIKMVVTITDAICQIVANKTSQGLISNEEATILMNAFLDNSENYCNEIEQVAIEIQSIVDNATQKYIVMADRFPMRYFVEYYGLDYDAAFAGCSTAVEASTSTIARLIKTTKELDLPAVFYLEMGNIKLANTVAKEANVNPIMLYSVQNISRNDFNAGETWVSLMKKNIEALKKGLK